MQTRSTVSQPFSSGSAVSRLRAALPMLLGCWHRNLGRPFTRDDESYRACLDCGARRRFDLTSWRMSGPFFFQTTFAAEPMERASTAKKNRSRRAVRNEQILRLIA
ncbi:MAG TPA: hypothetical protein VIX17_18965 [Pyrinomonadaceae bacterium]